MSQVETIEEVDENDEIEDDAAWIDASAKTKFSSLRNEKVELTDDDRVSTFADIGVRDSVKSPPPTRRKSGIDLLQGDSFSSDLSDAILMIRKISLDYELNAKDNLESNTTTHSSRMKAVDELLRSHTYAAEMRRAAKSASNWLYSIGRSEGSADEKDQLIEDEVEGQHVSAQEEASVTPSQPSESQDQEAKQSAGEEQETERVQSVDKMDIVSLRALLRSAELKAKEKEDMAVRLNEELSKCRAEIGRLKTASRTEVSTQLRNESSANVRFSLTHDIFFTTR